MSRRFPRWLAGVCGLLMVQSLAAGGEPSSQARARSSANQPPRKVLIGTVIFGPYGRYEGLGQRMKELSGLVDSMAAEAERRYPGRRLDLAVLPETTVTTRQGPASARAVALDGPVLETFASLARRHQTYLV